MQFLSKSVLIPATLFSVVYGFLGHVSPWLRFTISFATAGISFVICNKSSAKQMIIQQLSRVDVAKETHENSQELPTYAKVTCQKFVQHVIDSVVPQRGPSCAAAVVASACNALINPSPKIKARLALRSYKFMFRTLFDDKLKNFEKTLGISIPLEAIEEIAAIFAASLELTAKKKAFSASVTDILRKIEIGTENLVSSTIIPILKMDLGATNETPRKGLVMEQFRTTMQCYKSLMKLSRKLNPSTAPIGNDRIILATKAVLAANGQQQVRATELFGISAKARNQISDDENGTSEEDKVYLWEELKLAIERQAQNKSVLIFHLNNHYALIGGWRELLVQYGPKSSDVYCHRQILTARAKQELRHWVDFDTSFSCFSELKQKVILRKSVLQTLKSWKGYKILQFELNATSSSRKNAVVDQDVQKVAKIALYLMKPHSESDNDDDNDNIIRAEEEQHSDDNDAEDNQVKEDDD